MCKVQAAENENKAEHDHDDSLDGLICIGGSMRLYEENEPHEPNRVEERRHASS